jgi:hypothetical protein
LTDGVLKPSVTISTPCRLRIPAIADGCSD